MSAHFASWPVSDAAIPTEDTCPTFVCDGDHREMLVQRFRLIDFREYISPSCFFFLNALWSAVEHYHGPIGVLLTRLMFPADAYEDYVTSYIPPMFFPPMYVR